MFAVGVGVNRRSFWRSEGARHLYEAKRVRAVRMGVHGARKRGCGSRLYVAAGYGWRVPATLRLTDSLCYPNPIAAITIDGDGRGKTTKREGSNDK